MEVFELLIPPPQPSELLGGERTIDIDADAHVGECYPFWTVTNINRPHKFADPEFGKELAIRQPFAKEVNLVYLLGGRHEGQNCWFRGVGPGGEVHADFSGLISQLTGVTQAGYVPRIILNNVPEIGRASCRERL